MKRDKYSEIKTIDANKNVGFNRGEKGQLENGMAGIGYYHYSDDVKFWGDKAGTKKLVIVTTCSNCGDYHHIDVDKVLRRVKAFKRNENKARR